MSNTALSAERKAITENIIFNGKEHEEFYIKYLSKCQYQDEYHRSLLYSLGISSDTRNHINEIFDYRRNCIKPECINSGWQTSGSLKIVRLAFNLYNNGIPTAMEIEDPDKRLDESRCYAVDDIFCCSYAKYLMQAVEIRYPEYFNPVTMEEALERLRKRREKRA